METPEQFAARVVLDARRGWVNGTFDVAGVGQVGIKAFGKWVQRMCWNGVQDSAPEFKTQRDMRAWIAGRLTA